MRCLPGEVGRLKELSQAEAAYARDMQRPCGRKERSMGSGALKRREKVGMQTIIVPAPQRSCKETEALSITSSVKRLSSQHRTRFLPGFSHEEMQWAQRPSEAVLLDSPPASWMQMHPLITVKYQEPQATCLGGRGSFLPKLWSVSTVFQMEIRQLISGT